MRERVFRRVSPGRPIPSSRGVALKCAKRGNDVYQKRVERRLRFLVRIFGYVVKGDVDFWKISEDTANAHFVEVTLTCPASSFTVKGSWLDWIGANYNRWWTGIKQKFEGAQMVRAWESTENGYPHVHLLLWLPEAVTVYKHLDKSLKWSWRADVETRDRIAQAWGAFSDVKGVRTLSTIARYLVKHVVKGTESSSDVESRGDLTRSLLWIYRKRSFSLSRDFQKRLTETLDLIRRVHNSKEPASSVKGGSIWEVVAIAPASAYGWSGEDWCIPIEVAPG